MIIGFNAFGEEHNLAFDSRLFHMNYDKLEMTGGVIDHIYIDEDITVPYTVEKPENWMYQTVLSAGMKNNLEGGSIEANNVQIEKVRFQRRQWNELEWEDVAEIEYNPSEKMLYEAIDKYVANDFTYQYSIIPITSTILGNRVVSDEITTKFEGVFISDKDSNYQLLYDIELSGIENVRASAMFEPQNSRYPIVAYGNLDYTTFDITSTFISAETFDGGGNNINIRMERLGKDNLLRFMKNGKPKIYRDQNGDLKLVSVVGNPRETPYNNVHGIAKLSFSLVEIGDTDSETLKANNMLEGLSEVF